MHELHLRLLKHREKEITYFGERKFSRPEYESLVMASMPGIDKFNKELDAIHRIDVPPELRILYQYPLLTKEQEYHLFRKFNYCKYRAKQLLKKVNFKNMTESILGSVEAWLKEASDLKHLLAACNTRLVGNLAKKQYDYLQDPNLETLCSFISDGNVGMLRAIDYFDFRLGLKFSTYATWAIMDTLGKSRQQRNKHADRQSTNYDDVLYEQIDKRNEPAIDFSDRECLRKLVKKLAPRSREVIQRYYGLVCEPENLEKIGVRLNLSKERVRQIKEESLGQLRTFANVG
jgi:RNA polymerase sigma factor (sigma-70 family)